MRVVRMVIIDEYNKYHKHYNDHHSGGSSNINSYNDVMAFKSSTSAASVMLARAAMHNVSIFRKEGLLSVEKVIHDFMKYVSWSGEGGRGFIFSQQQENT